MNRRVFQAIIAVAFFGWGFVILVSPVAEAATYEGYLTVGSRKYEVTLQVIKNSEASFWIGAAVSESGVVLSRFGAQISDSGSNATQGEISRTMLPNVARSWLRELQTKFLALVDCADFLVVTTDSAVTCESRSPLMLTDAMAGKVRLTYKYAHSGVRLDPTPAALKRDSAKLQLTEIQAFSLEEWLNGFGDRVILSLRRTPREEGMTW